MFGELKPGVWHQPDALDEWQEPITWTIPSYFSESTLAEELQ